MDYPLPIGAVPGSHKNKTFSVEEFLGMERQYVKYIGYAIGFVFCPFICPEIDYAIFKSNQSDQYRRAINMNNWKNLISNKYVREYTKLTISASDTSNNKKIQIRQPTCQKGHIPEGQPLSEITTTTAATPTTTATTATATGTTTKAVTATTSTESSNINSSTVTSATLFASLSVGINNPSLPSSFKARRSKRSKAATLLFTGFTESLTVKFLSAVHLGLKITTKKWLDASIKDGKLLDPNEFPLVDEIVEREQMFNLRDSLEEARSNSERITLEQIVRSAGGQMMKKIKELDHSNSCNLVIIDPINQVE
ncbi:hypothetical protein INT45_014289 [Circinella minor]|uniref:BRCT domain-containing protein n=1 Tax=Circinella minor TaxID=1195481 RepID=A0A8H7SDD0_9FUNG|nr:hypothetical protein INT45_014289 [Circinella minor]